MLGEGVDTIASNEVTEPKAAPFLKLCVGDLGGERLLCLELDAVGSSLGAFTSVNGDDPLAVPGREYEVVCSDWLGNWLRSSVALNIDIRCKRIPIDSEAFRTL